MLWPSALLCSQSPLSGPWLLAMLPPFALAAPGIFSHTFPPPLPVIQLVIQLYHLLREASLTALARSPRHYKLSWYWISFYGTEIHIGVFTQFILLLLDSKVCGVRSQAFFLLPSYHLSNCLKFTRIHTS